MKSKHKILSFMLSIAMLVTCFIPMQVTHAANAELVDENAGKARLVLQLLKEDSTNTALGYSEMSQSEVDNLKNGSDFYLGVRFENLGNVINVSDVGLGRIGLAIAFDNEYLSVEPDVKAANRNNLNAANARQTIGDRLASQTALGDEYGYGYAVNAMAEATTSDRPGENFNVVSYSLQTSVETEGLYKGNEDAYVAIIAFRIIKDGPEGGYSDVLRFSETANQFSMEVGVEPNSGSKYRAYQSVATTGFGLLTDAIEFDETGAIIFPNIYEITYHDNATDGIVNGTSVEGKKQSAKDGKTFAESEMAFLNSPTRKGFIFDGWTTDAAGNNSFTEDTKVTSDLDLYAQWREGYTIEFDLNGGQIGSATTVDPIELATGETIKAEQVPNDPTRTDYDFLGWTIVGTTTTYKTAAEIAAHNYNDTSTTYYANWKATGAEQSTVTFDGNGAGSVVTPTAITVNTGDSVGAGIAVASRTNYVFKGWNDEQNGTGNAFTSTTNVDADMTVYAQWDVDPSVPDDQKVTVTFNSPDADTNATPGSITIVMGDVIGKGNMPNVPLRNNYVFGKWYVDADNSNSLDDSEITDTNIFTGEDPVTTNTAVFATWRSSTDVTFDKRSGSWVTDPGTYTVTINAGQKITSDIFDTYAVTAPDGYTFIEWNTEANGSGDKVDENYELEDNITASAIYQAADPDPDDPTKLIPTEGAITVIFDNNGGTGVNPDKIYVTSGDAIDAVVGLPAAPTRTNYKFDGWYTMPLTSTGQTEVTGATVPSTLNTLSEDNEVTVYAHWTVENEADRAVVTFHNNYDKSTTTGGVIGRIQVFKGTTIDPIPVTIERTGFSFVEWHNEGGTTVAMTDTINEDIHLYAIWSTGLYFEFTADSASQDFDNTVKSVTVAAIKANDASGAAITEYVTEGIDYKISYDPANPTAVGSYDIGIDSGDGSTNPNADRFTIEGWNPESFKIVGKPLTIALASGSTQLQKTNGETTVSLSFTVTDAADKGFTATGDDFDIKYFSWTDKQTNESEEGYGVVSADELSASEVVPSAYGKYVVDVDMKDKNFRVGALQDIDTYQLATDEDTVKRFERVGSYIVLEIVKAVSLDDMDVQLVTSSGAITSSALYTDDTLTTEAAFSKDRTDPYYTQVPDGEKLQIVLEGTLPADAVTITLGGFTLTEPDDITITTTAGVNEGEVVMTITVNKELDKVDGNGNGFKNDVIIGVGDDEYTIKVRELEEAAIKLTPGNSPYGLIELMGTEWYTGEGIAWTEEEIAAAKTAFNIDNRFTAEYTPTNGVTGQGYSPMAWVGADLTGKNDDIANPDINMDRNVNAQFIYDGKAFVDSGFKAIDSLGKEVADEDITFTIAVDKMSSAGLDFIKDAAITTEQVGLDEIESIHIRPGVYELKYEFYDSATNTTVSAIRNIVVVWENGDANLSLVVDGTDASTINNIVAGKTKPREGVNEKAANIYEYRIADANNSAVVDGTDANTVNTNVAGKIDLAVYYK